MDKVGNLYGTTEWAARALVVVMGAHRVSACAGRNGNNLYSFQRNHGTGPTSSLLAGKNGELYGTTTRRSV